MMKLGTWMRNAATYDSNIKPLTEQLCVQIKKKNLGDKAINNCWTLEEN